MTKGTRSTTQLSTWVIADISTPDGDFVGAGINQKGVGTMTAEMSAPCPVTMMRGVCSLAQIIGGVSQPFDDLDTRLAGDFQQRPRIMAQGQM